MKIGLQIPSFTWPGGPPSLGADLARVVETADSCGFASIWVMDHFFQIGSFGSRDLDMLEAYLTLGFIAGRTEKARLGTMVTGAIYRPPGLLCKQVSALDVLSGGRAWLGIGAGWNEQEAKGLGLPWAPLGERFERLEETLQVCLQMWQGDRTPYHGKHVVLEEPINSPQALTKPHPPILIGGGGERKTLRLVAQYADACNLFPGPQLPHKLRVLREHCETLGRDYDAIEKTSMFNFDTRNVGKLLGQLKWMAGMGIQTVIGSIRSVHEIEPLEVMGREVIPAAAEI